MTLLVRLFIRKTSLYIFRSDRTEYQHRQETAKRTFARVQLKANRWPPTQTALTAELSSSRIVRSTTPAYHRLNLTSKRKRALDQKIPARSPLPRHQKPALCNRGVIAYHCSVSWG